MQEKVYSDIDGSSDSDYLARVNVLLSNPNQNILDLDYDSVLFWNYLAEQFGTATTEPAYGVDFISRYWERAADASPDVVGALEATLGEFDRRTTATVDYGVSLTEIFQDFSIANIAKDLDLTDVDSPGRYRYEDEDDGTGMNYGSVARAWSDDIPPAHGPASDSVAHGGGATYYQANTTSLASGLVGFLAESDYGDMVTYALLALKAAEEPEDDDRLKEIYRGASGGGGRFAVALVQDAADPYSGLFAVVNGYASAIYGTSVDLTYTFAGGEATVDILEPTSEYPAYVGAHDAPERFLVRLQVTGPPELGEASVEGLGAEQFEVYVGREDPADEATVLAAAYAQVGFVVTRPGGAEVEDGVDGAEVVTDATHQVGHLDGLEDGNWTLSLTGESGAGKTTAITELARQATQAALETPRSAAAPVVPRLKDEAVGQPEAPSASGTLGR